MTSKRLVVCLVSLTIASMILGLPSKIVPAAKGDAAGVTLSAFTPNPPVINGTIISNQWANAARMDFVGVYGVVRGTIYVMNDGKNLYIAVRIADTQLLGRDLNISIDNNHDGTYDVGETDFTWYIGMTSFDRYVTNSSPYSLGAQPETNVGATVDGSAAATNSGGYNTYEFAHELCSGDLTYDMCVSPGDTIGFNLIYQFFGDGGDQWPAPFIFPLNDASHWGDIIIARPPLEISVSNFFTDSSLNPLLLNSNGSPTVNVTLASGVVRSTNPGQIVGWVNVTNTGGLSVQSLSLNETLPVDWAVSPVWMPPKGSVGAIHVYYANGTSLAAETNITLPSTITVFPGNPEIVSLTISNFTATAMGHSLMPGESVLLSVKLVYGLIMTSQSFSSYPRNYSDTAIATAFTSPFLSGMRTSVTSSVFFTAHAKVLGDLNGDGKVNFMDVSIAVYAFGSSPGNPRWNPNVDFNNDGFIGFTDISTEVYCYATG